MKATFFLSLFLTCLSAFSQETNISDDLIGIWLVDSYEGSYYHYKKVKSFKNNDGGIQFKAGGELVRRQNAGWCGTPPITYSNFEGTWEMESDSVIQIMSTYWGGKLFFNFEIVEFSSKTMKVKWIHVKDETNHVKSEIDEDVQRAEIEEMEEEETEVFVVVEKMPLYGTATTKQESSEQIMQYFVGKSKDQEFENEGKVFIRFNVNEEGDVEDVKVLRSPDDDLSELATEWVFEMGKWQPGEQRGKAVTVSMTLPIVFGLTD